MPPHTSKQCRQNQNGMQGPTQGQAIEESSTQEFRLATFLLQMEAEGWRKSILARRSDAHTLEAYSKINIIPAHTARPTRMRVTGVEVKNAFCVERSLAEKKSAVELSHGASTASGFRGRGQRRFTSGVNISEGTSGARQKGVVGRPRQQGKVYVMTQQEAKDAPDIIIELLSEGLAIYTPANDVLLVSEVLSNCEVLVEGISMLVDLLPLELQRKEEVSRKPGSAEMIFRGMRKIIPRSLISVFKAEKLLRKGCIAFLAHVEVQRE
ncbi:Retroviral aspartyl protease [Cucumis melo var. makuwa]|uniref:Retroviral aspartyl protease n=1 Tax=Cucumis melo var. makuwa TaxID=1194695 RepID=A0A5D3DBK0_CUCMM|nr:Retroviral aspartyl protease [Cucumis melo var. makuwa]TYK20943.1 Retroviral aspartyl protease [Cucumis melo var. makuwa]